jgi:hypothetical protein
MVIVSELRPPTDLLFFPQMIHEYGALVEWRYWQGKTKNSVENLSQSHFFHHKSHMDWPGTVPGPPRWEAGDYPSTVMALPWWW